MANKKVSEVEKINLTLQTDQSSHTVLNGVNFTLTYGNYTKSYTWNGSTITIEVPAYVTYTITFGGMTNYTTPASITYTAQTGNSRTVNAVYTIQKETVTVKCSGLSSGFTLTVKNATSGATIGSQTTTSKSYQIPAGTKYYVTASTVSGYNKPANSSTYTAVANSTRTVTMTYKVAHAGTTSPTNGVWIQDTDRYYHTASNWSGEYTPNGIAVITSNCRFVMALQDHSLAAVWSNQDFDVQGLPNYDTFSEDGARNDYNGKSNTTAILNALVNYIYREVPAAERCNDFTFPNGQSGYLGSLGEWVAVENNKSAIDTALSKCGNALSGNRYWSSTESDSYSAWSIGMGSNNAGITRQGKTNNSLKIRPFTTI